MSTTNLELQLKRLTRHYESSLRTYDDVSLLDLAHALRFWADLRSMLGAIAPKALTTIAFKNGTPSRKLIARIRDFPYVVCLLPGGVVSYAHNGELMSTSSKLLGDADFSAAHRLIRRADGAVELKEVVLVAGTSKGSNHTDQHSFTRCSFPQWLDGEAVRVNTAGADGKLRPIRITLELMIRRVANSLDASHPAGMPNQQGKKHPQDDLIESLLATRIAGLSLPYVVLLHAAQELVKLAPSWLDK